MSRGPSTAEWEALTAWWMAKRHIGRAAALLGRKRQTVANNLNTFRRLEDVTDTVELALRHLDEIERRKPDVLGKVA